MLQTQIGLPFCPSINKAMGKKHHWRLVMAKRGLAKLGIQSSYISNSQLFVDHAWINGHRRNGFAIHVITTDLPGLFWTIDHFKVQSMASDFTFVLLAAGNDELFKKLVHFSVLKPSEI